MQRIKATKGSSWVDHPPPGRWTYRVGLAANWLNDPTRGDVLLISEPVRESRLGRSARAFAAAVLDQVQQRVLDSMRADGIALVPFQELFGDEALWDELRRDIGAFTAHTEANLDGAAGAAEEEVVSDPALPEERPAVHARRPVAPVRALEPRCSTSSTPTAASARC